MHDVEHLRNDGYELQDWAGSSAESRTGYRSNRLVVLDVQRRYGYLRSLPGHMRDDARADRRRNVRAVYSVELRHLCQQRLLHHPVLLRYQRAVGTTRWLGMPNGAIGSRNELRDLNAESTRNTLESLVPWARLAGDPIRHRRLRDA